MNTPSPLISQTPSSLYIIATAFHHFPILCSHYSLPNDLASFYSSPFMNELPDDTTFRNIHIPGIEDFFIVDQDFTGGLHYIARRIRDYIFKASADNPDSSEMVRELNQSALEELSILSPKLVKEIATYLDNPFIIPGTIDEIKSGIRRFQDWARQAMEWIILAKFATDLRDGVTNWVWPDEPELSLPFNFRATDRPSPLSLFHSELVNINILDAYPRFLHSIFSKQGDDLHLEYPDIEMSDA
ncbi:hypothetical protein M422DRAFT_44694 [Sphaerobolus stellatus SS14]|nr:hypothetical protein M422DRAFT_44694 [Sphaerobolus stellatus SS14]